MPANRIHIVGRKNSGKTTLVTELVRELSRRGLRVATIKHTHHHHELDTPGKDSHRHREAGAAMVAILAPGMTAVFEPQATDRSSDERLEDVCGRMTNCDLILVEGGQHCAGAKVEVWRSAVSEEPLARTDPSILAVVTDDATECQQPIVGREDISRVADEALRLAGSTEGT